MRLSPSGPTAGLGGEHLHKQGERLGNPPVAPLEAGEAVRRDPEPGREGRLGKAEALADLAELRAGHLPMVLFQWHSAAQGPLRRSAGWAERPTRPRALLEVAGE